MQQKQKALYIMTGSFGMYKYSGSVALWPPFDIAYPSIMQDACHIST